MRMNEMVFDDNEKNKILKVDVVSYFISIKCT